MRKVEAGEICTGVVVSKTAFGVFIDVGAGKDALLHRSNLRGNNRNLREQRFEEIRNAGLLILDDFGTQNATPWAQEKLFQIINFRYINKLPTVITTSASSVSSSPSGTIGLIGRSTSDAGLGSACGPG